MKRKSVMAKFAGVFLAAVLTAASVFSVCAFTACGDETEPSGFTMTYELAREMNMENFGVNVAEVSANDLANFEWWNDGFIRMSDPEEKLEELKYYSIVHNLEITKSDGETYNIYGYFQVPLDFDPSWITDDAGGRTWPVAVQCHGYNTNSNGFMSADWANTWVEKGYITYCFDFVGGSSGGKEVFRTGVRSGNKELETWTEENNPDWMNMSVYTEVEDLDCVLNALKELPFVQDDNFAVLGQSQGGVVAAIEAARREEARAAEGLENDIKGLVLVYPAFSFVNDMHVSYPTLDDMYDAVQDDGRIFIMGANIGTKYITDMYDEGEYNPDTGLYEIYDLVAGYSNSVLIVTGSGDTTVDPSWSFNAINQLTSPYGDSQSTLVLVSNAVHAFDMMSNTPLKQKQMCWGALADYLDLNGLTVNGEDAE